MKLAAPATLLFATLALASPAPAPDANAAAVALEAVVPSARAPFLEERAKKPKGGSGGNSTGAADMLSPSRALQLGALTLGVMQTVRLW
ncbi:hypothetical protein BDU57DRAFT_447661 [Ampelomyces quisqualis]|uniref:Uncharacterized protein n=1 Tax=Ampelomyces quisqualis TaxID=50730 RepID=A0A6A5QK27_AMPQU|nr:hypothetical protein BDU57DRAFT_447661 [Ampelomyces quisqualis]